MLDSFIIVGLTVVIVNIVKAYKPFKTVLGKLYLPLIIFTVAGVLNVINAFVFGGSLLVALRDGFIFGAASSGIYSMGKKQIDKYKQE